MSSRREVAGPWFVSHSREGGAALRLFCFPYAGGNAQIFRPWAQALSTQVEVIGVQTPGKGGRMLEAPLQTISELVDAIATAIEPMLQQGPCIFFGHSNGALLAFELSCLLQRRGLPTPRHLFLSASPAPWTRVIEEPYSTMPVERFKDVLRDLEGTPAEILDNPELFELILPGLRADFALAEGYRYEHPGKLQVPTTVFYGLRDRITQQQIFAWQQQIKHDVEFVPFDGGHFYIHSHAEQLTRALDARTRALAEDAAAA